MLYGLNSVVRVGLHNPRGPFVAVIGNAVRAYGEIILVEPLMRKHYATALGRLTIN